jgi:hypothetical protein
LRVFGSLAFVYIPQEKPKKFDYCATPEIFVGNCITTKLCLIYDQLARALHCSRDSIFRDNRWCMGRHTADEAIVLEHIYAEEILEDSYDC